LLLLSQFSTLMYAGARLVTDRVNLKPKMVTHAEEATVDKSDY